MGLPAWYTNLAKVVLPECIYFENTIIGPLFVLIDYYPILVSISIFMLSLYRAELMFRILALLMIADVFVNWLLREAIFIVPSRLTGCGNVYEMPSFATQHLVFLTFLLHYIMLRRKKPINKKLLFMLHMMSFFGTVARIYIGFNTLSELYAGSLVGLIEGLICCPLIVDRIIDKRTEFLKWAGGNRIALWLFSDETIFG